MRKPTTLPRFELWCDRCGRPIRANYLALYCVGCGKAQARETE